MKSASALLAATAAAALWGAQPADAAPLTFTIDLTTQGTFSATGYSFGPQTFASTAVAPGGTLELQIDFLGSQALRVTDVVAGAPPQEQMANFTLSQTAAPTGTLPSGVIGTVDLLLSGVFGGPSLQPNPDQRNCTTNAPLSACSTGGFGDLINTNNGFVGFDGFTATFTNTTATTVSFLGFGFQVSGELVERTTAPAAVPEPASAALLLGGLAALGIGLRRRG